MPIDMTAETRQRTSVYDQRQNTFVHGYVVGSAPQVRTAFETVVPNGTYHVFVGMGDSQYFDSVYAPRAEGQALVTSNSAVSSAAPLAYAEGNVVVTDGKLTLDGGTAPTSTNPKFSYLEITDAPPATAPAAPTSVTATAGTSQVTLNWAANTESDLAGYDVYRSTTTTVDTSATATPINGTNRVTARTYIDSSVTNATKYYYAIVAVNTSALRSPASSTANATPTAPNGVSLKFNFQPSGITPPAQYTADIGQPYSAARGFGFVRWNTLNTPNHLPLDVTDRVVSAA